MNALTFAHVSDLHLPFDPRLSPGQRFSKRQLSAWSWRRRRHLQRPEILEALVADLRARAPDPIAITGDVTNFSLPEEFRRAAVWLESLGPPERISLVPGNHDALVPMEHAEGLGRWAAWMRSAEGWPSVLRRAGVTFIGLNSALPTAPLRASGRIGRPQLERLQSILEEEGAAGHLRVLMLHHPVADHAVGWRKALVDRAGLRAVLERSGSELILHGHARDARLDAVAGPWGPIPCLCVPSSSAIPNPRDEGARWHLVSLRPDERPWQAQVLVRQWSVAEGAFIDAARYELSLPDPGAKPPRRA